jgi:hypothetical protein
MTYNFFNLVSGVKNQKAESEKLISYIDPTLIMNLLGQMQSISQKLFNGNESNRNEFVITFFDFSVRSNGYCTAFANQLASAGDKQSKQAADHLFKFAHNIKRLGITVASNNKDVFEEHSKSLFGDYHLEFNSSDTTIHKTLNRMSYVYDSWVAVCNVCVINSDRLKPEDQQKLQTDIDVASELISVIVGYLFGVLEKNNHQWEDFIDNNLRKYWDVIPDEHKAR